MKKYIIITLFLSFLTTQAQWTQIGQNINGEAPEDLFGNSVSINNDGSIVAIGAYLNDGNGINAGHVRVFESINGIWTQIGQDIDGDVAYDQFGVSLSLSSNGSIIAIGATLHDENGTNSGQVKVYQNLNENWIQIGQSINGEADDDRSGYLLSLSSDGTVVAIGATRNDGNGSNSGHVRIFKFTNETWTQIGQDIDGEMPFDEFGYSLNLSSDGTVVAVGAFFNDGNGNNAGHVRIYQNINETWMQIGEDIDGESADDFSGFALSLSSDGLIVAIGAPSNDGNGNSAGHVRIYQNINETWTQIGEDIDGEAEGDISGTSLSINSDGSIIAIGAYGNNISAGHVRIYKNINGTWVQIDEDIDGESTFDESGFSVSLSSDGATVAIGAILNDENGNNAGNVRVFRNETLGSSEFTINEITFYPNPTKGIINFKNINSNTIQVFIYDVIGSLIYNHQHSISNNLLQINISSFENGIYFINIQKENEFITTKVIKE